MPKNVFPDPLVSVLCNYDTVYVTRISKTDTDPDTDCTL